MKWRIISLMLACCLLLCACKQEEKQPESGAYSVLCETAQEQSDALGCVLYSLPQEDEKATVHWGEHGDEIRIVPRFPGSTVSIYEAMANGTGSYFLAETALYSTVAADGCSIALSMEYPGWNRIYYLQIETPDGRKAGNFLPLPCETERTEIWVLPDQVDLSLLPADWGEEEIVFTEKPVIYLYPQTKTQVHVELDYCGELTCSYPRYEAGWTVTACPDGTLTDERGQSYSYLYWEGEGYDNFDFSTGFCVAGADTAAFLEDTLAKLGLTRREANEFIIYWLPMMEGNAYNVISFQTETYTEAAKLAVTPEPDSLIRVFMAWYGSESAVELPAQELITPVREGFTVVEWGGSRLPS